VRIYEEKKPLEERRNDGMEKICFRERRRLKK